MAETASNMLPLGTPAFSFNLKDSVSEKFISLQEIKSDKATVIMFICNHCPYVKLILDKLVDIAKEYKTKGISFVAINSNDIKNYPDDAPDKMKWLAQTKHFSFPYLMDETQEIARAYQAACTPDFYVFDNHLKCVYRGRFDDATPGNKHKVTGEDLVKALNTILVGGKIDSHQKPSLGCNIKWKK